MKYLTGIHHYYYRLYALDTVPDSDGKALLAAIQGHVIDEAALIGHAEGDGFAL